MHPHRQPVPNSLRGADQLQLQPELTRVLVELRTGEEFAKLVTRINTARDLRKQLDKRTDKRITAEFANAQLQEADLRDRDKLERIEAKVMAEVARRHGELGQAVGEYTQDSEHGTWELERYLIPAHPVANTGTSVSPLFQQVVDDTKKYADSGQGTGANIDVASTDVFNKAMWDGMQGIVGGTRTPTQVASALQAAAQKSK